MQAYAEYKDSGVDWLGEIPSGWELVSIGSSFNERREKVSDKDFEPLSVTKNGILPQLANAAKTNDGDNRKLVKGGDFVINSRSDRKGSSGVAKQDGSVSLINIVMEPKGIDPVFCNRLLKSNAFVEEFYRMGHGIVADLWTTRYSEMKTVQLALPPLAEQTAIADFLDDKTAKIEALIGIKRRQIALLEECKQILIQNAVTKGLNPDAPMKDSGIDWIGEIPAGWEKQQVKRLFAIGRGRVISKEELDENGSFPVYSSQTKNSGILGYINTCDFDAAQITWTTDGVNAGTVFLRSGKYNCTNVCGTLKPKTDRTNLPFCAYTIGVAALFYKRTDTNGAKIMNEEMAVIEFPLPLLAEQTAIADFIDDESEKINAAIKIKENQIAKLNEYKTTLINAAVTGKIKVT